MPNTGGFEVMLQFKQDILNDILVRVLNESLISNLYLKSPISRLIDEPVPPTQVKVWWDKPELELDDDESISLSVEVTGGARQLITERNLSVEGSVSITRKALLATDEMGALSLSLESPQPLDLQMHKLKVSYPGSKWPPLLSRIDPTRETTILRPLLTLALLIPLSQLPLSYNLKSLPLRLLAPNSSPAPTEWSIPVTTAMMRVLKEADAVAIGLSLTKTLCDSTQMTTAFPEEVKSNAALTLTSIGLNNLLGQLRRHGALTGVIPAQAQEAPVNWQWEVLTIQCHHGYISLTGNFRRNTIPVHVSANLQCSLDRNGSLTITPLAINTDAPTTETIVSSLSEVLWMLLRARDTRDDHGEEWGKLFQCFTIAGTPIEVEAPAEDLLIEEETLTLLYDVPQTMKGFQAEVPWVKPQVTVSEPNIPTQTAPGAPVSMQMQAHLTTRSFPPYDYVWTTGLSEEPTQERGPSMTVTGSPIPAGPGSQVYTNVQVKVTDAFGQVAQASAPARYQARSRRQRSPARAIMVVALIMLILSGIGASALFWPTPSLSGPARISAPNMLNLSGSGFLAGGSVTLSLDGEVLALSGNHSRTADSLQNRGLILTLAQLAPNGTIAVSGSGTFTATINISALLLGAHTIHASETVFGIVRSADLTFNVVSQQALAVNITSLDFGQLQAGATATRSIAISNRGGQRLTWTIDTGGTAWLSVPRSTGTIDPGQADQTIDVTVDTSQLSAGSYSATLQIQSNEGDAQVTVSLVVLEATSTPTSAPTPPPSLTPSPTPTPTPVTPTPPPVPPGQLAVSPTGLGENCAELSDFVTLSNKGGQAVSWFGNSTDANFVVAPNSETLAPGSQVSVQIKGGDPQLVPGNSFSVYFQWSGPTLSVTVTCK